MAEASWRLVCGSPKVVEPAFSANSSSTPARRGDFHQAQPFDEQVEFPQLRRQAREHAHGQLGIARKLPAERVARDRQQPRRLHRLGVRGKGGPGPHGRLAERFAGTVKVQNLRFTARREFVNPHAAGKDHEESVRLLRRPQNLSRRLERHDATLLDDHAKRPLVQLAEHRHFARQPRFPCRSCHTDTSSRQCPQSSISRPARHVAAQGDVLKRGHSTFPLSAVGSRLSADLRLFQRTALKEGGKSRKSPFGLVVFEAEADRRA